MTRDTVLCFMVYSLMKVYLGSGGVASVQPYEQATIRFLGAEDFQVVKIALQHTLSCLGLARRLF